MTRLFKCCGQTGQTWDGSDSYPSLRQIMTADTRRQLTKALWMLALLSCLGLSCSGCQAGPAVPLGFGPPLDNLLSLLFLLVAGVILYRLFAPKFKAGPRVHSVGAAESIARERYARGEITEAEYNQIVRTLAAR